VATYAGWNLRGTGHSVGEGCSSTGSAIPFAVTAAAKSVTDTRASLDTLYPTRSNYVAQFSAAANALVSLGFLNPIDADTIYKVGATTISPALIPNP
jgi:hypothetical protein